MRRASRHRSPTDQLHGGLSAAEADELRRLQQREELSRLRLKASERKFDNDLRAMIRAAKGIRPPPAKRPRLLPDFETVYHAAVVALTREHTQLTWETVLTRIKVDHADNPKIGTLAESTVRRWAKEDDLPKPSDLAV